VAKITPWLWFDTQSEEAATFYTSLFDNSRITGIDRYGDAGPGPAGSVMTVSFELDGLPMAALNGGPEFDFTDAISFQVNCESQDEVDRLWNALTDGGEEGQCGWCTDRFGVSWQIVPTRLRELLSDPDPERSQRAMHAMFEMKKIDMAALERAAGGSA
jgi:predicted 3-demethylubiquinone-9 3-methyltransferase (glyoxalase superfamily)